MISQKKLDELHEFLEKAQNPLFLFDNDVDGLASFLLLRKFCQKGKGIAIKSFPALNVAYVRKLHELKPDCIFVLDKPLIEKAFREAARQFGMPLVWIDHHPVPDYANEEGIFYFNPLAEQAEQIPTSYICYKATAKKDDEWIALLGCIADWYIPEFAESFAKAFPDLFAFTKDSGKALYKTELGKIVKMLSFALMDRTSIVVQMLKNLLTIKNPRELLDITTKTASIHARYNQINRKYEKLLSKAKEIAETSKKLIFFQYGGELSISGLLANELLYLHPYKVIVVCYIKGDKVNVALRSNCSINVSEIAAKALEGMEATTGGHKEACGASLRVEDLPKFRDALIKLVEK